VPASLKIVLAMSPLAGEADSNGFLGRDNSLLAK